MSVARTGTAINRAHRAASALPRRAAPAGRARSWGPPHHMTMRTLVRRHFRWACTLQLRGVKLCSATGTDAAVAGTAAVFACALTMSAAACNDAASAEEDRRRWDAKHLGQRPRVEPPEFPPELDVETLIPRRNHGGRALEIACGTGGVSLWLASRGYAVTALDVSPVALGILASEAQASNLSGQVSTSALDLMSALPPGIGTFDVVVCQRFRAPAIYAQLPSVLAPGGVLVITVLSTVGHSGKPSRFRAAPGELLAALSPTLEVVGVHEGNGIATLVARRPDVRT